MMALSIKKYKMMLSQWKVLLVAVFVFVSCASVSGKIIRIEIKKTESYNNGRLYGNAGAYEKITGIAFGEVDPKDSHNSVITDIQLAPKNERGLVAYSSEFIILRPKDMAKSNGLLFLSLPNRGNVFASDSALLKRGYVYFWAAWQGDILPGNNRLLMQVPVATDHGTTITGKVRSEYEVEAPTATLPLSGGYFTGLSHHSYETISLDNSTATLTKRMHETEPRIPIDPSEWAFADCSNMEFPGTPSMTTISIKGKFDPNYIYELIYTAKDPLILGLGFSAIRDFACFLRYEIKDGAGNLNPLLDTDNASLNVKAAIVQGVSQCGNFTRSFLLLGFNQSEQNRKVFDGVNDHVAPRRIALNVRFGRPGGAGIQREDHYFPGNEPPFTWSKTYEPISKITGGILDKSLATNTVPKIIQTFSSSEYWQSRASLRTTDSYGKKDVAIPENVRMYLFSSTQHGPSGKADKVSGFSNNNNQFGPYLRTLIVALEHWVLENATPPKSNYPKIADHTLVAPKQDSTGWPNIPGVTYSGTLNSGPLLDFGPQFNKATTSGILVEPPVVMEGKAYQPMVPKVDADGNELAGIRSVTILAPLGTYTGWSLRKQGYGEGDLNALNGMFIPFKKTKAERLAANDPRLSLEERYINHEGYVTKVIKAAASLVSKGYLLADDAKQIISEAQHSDVLK